MLCLAQTTDYLDTTEVDGAKRDGCAFRKSSSDRIVKAVDCPDIVHGWLLAFVALFSCSTDGGSILPSRPALA
jgi:hypothetical protein